MITVIKKGLVITMDDKRNEKIEKLDVVIENDTIIALEENYLGNYDKLIDATNKVIMPGLINCHTHLGMSIFRCTNDSLSLMDWLNKKIWPIENNMTDEDIYYTTLLSCIEMIKTGTTTSADHYFGKNTIDAVKNTKIREIFTRCLMDSDGNGDERINEFINLYEENKDKSPLITFSVSPHSLYTCSKDYLDKIQKLALKYNLPIHMHFSENLDEIETIKNTYNLKPAYVLDKLNLFENKLVLAHGVFIDDEEIELLKDKDISIVHNPISNLNLGCGFAPISKYIKNNINVCIGTDGQGSGNSLNMFEHIRYVDMLQKALFKDPTVINSYDVLKMATINGAKAFNLDDKIGSIEVGKKADMIILNLNNIEIYPVNDIISQIVHGISFNNVETTIINGDILMENQQLLLDIDENDLKNKIKKIVERLNI
ncbi:MAG: amidohydrolase [Bacilli bacterium]|nr:amidohydrolase [Bacilli bacterium]